MMILIRKRGITDGIYHAEILTTLIQQSMEQWLCM